MKKVYITLDSHPAMERRLSVFFKAISVFFLLLVTWFWYIQIIRHPYYVDLAEKHRIRSVLVSAPRGVIKDRNGNTVASTTPNFTIEIHREELTDKKAVFTGLAAILNVDVEDVEKQYEERLNTTPPLYPVLLWEGLDRDQMVAIEANRWRLKGVHINHSSERSYPFGIIGAHLVGYVSNINKKDLEKMKSMVRGGKIGKAGLENIFEDYLKGYDGVEKIEVDAYGKKQKVVYKVDPVSGGEIVLSIDWALQEAAEKAMGDRKGAVIVVSPKTGEIYAMVSHPNFDPNLFVSGFNQKEWAKVVDDPYFPLQNKATQGVFPPGSIFKLVTAIAALEEGIIDRNTTFTCTGKRRVGFRDYRCWNEAGHGKIGIHRALVESCDIFFYETAFKLGPERLSQYARLLGLGEKTGIPLPGELKGLVPDSQWKMGKLNLRWYDGDTASYSIGQGYLTVSPLQMAMAYAAFCNGMGLISPVIIKEMVTADGQRIEEELPKIRKTLNFKPETIEIIRKGLIGCVNNPTGTGKHAKISKLLVAGKTGTAQVKGFKERMRYGGFLQDHAWFVGFAPAHDPQIVVCAFVMHGGHGGGAAAPVVKDVIESFFHIRTKVTHNESDTVQE